jgi:hypothetical protein
MREIILTQGKVALVDDEDFEELNKFKWYASVKKKTSYAQRAKAGQNQKKLFLHRVLIDAPQGFEVDHIDGDGLNNQKSNLRIVTRRENAQNRHINKSSRFFGVTWDKEHTRWRAAIKIKNVTKYLGLFTTEEEAHQKYLEAIP